MKLVASPYASLLDQIPEVKRHVVVLGSDTVYWEYGTPGDSVPVVLVHGFRGDHHGLEAVVAHLPKTHIIAPDLPGFGESEPLISLGHDIDGYATWLRAFVDKLSLTGTAVILGHSFGTIIVAKAIYEGLPAPKVILVNPIAAPALKGPLQAMTQLAVFYYWLGAKLPNGPGYWVLQNPVVNRITSLALVKTKVPALRAWVHNQHDRYFSAFANRGVVLDAFKASVSHDVTEYAPKITMPVHLIAAEHDQITSVAAVRKLSQLLPNATMCVIPAVGHLIHYETPAQAAAEIAQFIAVSE
jgi:pimeloyl-ACP methyl ester carboxylesterase